MFLKDLINITLDKLQLERNNDAHRLIAKERVNLAYKEIGNNTDVIWPYLKRTRDFRTVANYTTGTVTITKDSRTITGSGTTWTSAMVGRYFKPQTGSNWYRIIAFVSSTSLVLEQPIIESSASSLTYTIWKRFYYFPSEVNFIIDFGSWIRDGQLLDSSYNKIRSTNVDISNTGEPTEFVMFGDDPFESEYSAGTISLTKNNSTATGTGTSWLDNVEGGDILKSGDQVLRVKRVESDTSIKLLNRAVFDAAAGSSYTLNKDINIGCQLWYNPNASLILPYEYQKNVYDMVNEDYDRPELPEKFDQAIIDGAAASRLQDNDDAKWINVQALYSARISDLKATRFASKKKYILSRPKINSRGSYL